MKAWKTNDGREIEIKDMSTRHIKNCLAMLQRNGYVAESTIRFYLHCEPPMGEMAQYHFDQEFDRITMQPSTPFIDWFRDELTNRGETYER